MFRLELLPLDDKRLAPIASPNSLRPIFFTASRLDMDPLPSIDVDLAVIVVVGFLILQTNVT